MEFFDHVRERRLRIGVIGDIIKDVYYEGDVRRISPEFPVPILHSKDDKAKNFPGGAANVAWQFQHFNTDVYLYGLCERGFFKDLSYVRFNTSGCCPFWTGSNPRKIRFYDNNHDFPMLRWDIEKDCYGEENIKQGRQSVLESVRYGIKAGLDVVVLSNYDKGLFDSNLAQNVIMLCNEAGIPTIVDPKSNRSHWIGCTIFKPNAKEAYEMTGEQDWRKQAEILKKKTLCRGVVITQAGTGVCGLGDDFFERRHLEHKEVSSVIGAGDCFAAILAVGVAHGLPLAEVADIAFLAGSEYVKAKHNRPITPYELHRRIDPIAAKIIPPEELATIKRVCYPECKLAYSNGCFDVLHSGHLATLQMARSKGDKLVVALNSDASVRRLKGDGRPVFPLEDRQRVIAALDAVDWVTYFDEDTPLENIKLLNPYAVVKGGDYKVEDVVGYGIAKEVHVAPFQEGRSTTEALRKILSLS